jgi:hypothetical protein
MLAAFGAMRDGKVKAGEYRDLHETYTDLLIVATDQVKTSAEALFNATRNAEGEYEAREQAREEFWEGVREELRGGEPTA